MLTGPAGRARPDARATPAAGGTPGGTDGTRARGETAPPGSGGAKHASAADEDRVRATRGAYRTRRSGSGASESGSAAADGSAGGGGSDSAGGSGSEPFGHSADRGDSAGPARAGGHAGPAGRDRPGGSTRAPGSGRPSGGGDPRRRRGTRVATPGSTSYDDAPHDMEPEWAGATWYGDSSGTYWTINPKEYADPRKHGPEYLARARRAGQIDVAAAPEPGHTESPVPDRMDESEPPGAGRQERAARFAADPAASEHGRSPLNGARVRREARRSAAGGPPGGQDAAVGLTGRSGFSRAWTRDGIVRDAADLQGRGAAPARFGAVRSRRVLIALIAWLPPGLAAGLLINDFTGCGRYAASCAGPEPMLAWVVQPAIFALLLLLPALARLAAVASAFTGIAAVGAGVTLSAAGGTHAMGDTARGLLAAILACAYVAGIAGALSHRVLLPAWLRRTD